MRATAAASLALAASELSLVAVLVEATGFAASDVALCAWLFSSAFFASGVAVAFGASAFGAGFVASSALAGFAASSALASLFSVAAGVSTTSAFLVAGAGVSEVAAAVPERSIFGTDAPSPYALEAAGASD